jgi:hypothetical protein
MNPFRRRKMKKRYCRVSAELKKGIKMTEAEIKLEQVNKLKQQIKEFNQIIEKEQHDIEMLNSAVYHKILNEISLLKMIAFGIIADDASTKESLIDIINSKRESKGRT